MRLDGRLDATASLCLWPRLSECGSIDEVLLNIKMRAQIKGIIAKAGRTRPGLVEADMVGQANNMFWLLMNELQDGGVDLGEVYGWWCGWYDLYHLILSYSSSKAFSSSITSESFRKSLTSLRISSHPKVSLMTGLFDFFSSEAITLA